MKISRMDRRHAAGAFFYLLTTCLIFSAGPAPAAASQPEPSITAEAAAGTDIFGKDITPEKRSLLLNQSSINPHIKFNREGPPDHPTSYIKGEANPQISKEVLAVRYSDIRYAGKTDRVVFCIQTALDKDGTDAIETREIHSEYNMNGASESAMVAIRDEKKGTTTTAVILCDRDKNIEKTYAMTTDAKGQTTSEITDPDGQLIPPDKFTPADKAVLDLMAEPKKWTGKLSYYVDPRIMRLAARIKKNGEREIVSAKYKEEDRVTFGKDDGKGAAGLPKSAHKTIRDAAGNEIRVEIADITYVDEGGTMVRDSYIENHYDAAKGSLIKSVLKANIAYDDRNAESSWAEIVAQSETGKDNAPKAARSLNFIKDGKLWASSDNNDLMKKQLLQFNESDKGFASAFNAAAARKSRGEPTGLEILARRVQESRASSDTALQKIVTDAKAVGSSLRNTDPGKHGRTVIRKGKAIRR